MVHNPGPQARPQITSKKSGKGGRARGEVQQDSSDYTTTVAPALQGSGRQSGRLREKGTTTYTTNGEVFRGGKRVNEGKYAGM